MQYWLMKSEPDTYSIDDLQSFGVDHWDGIRNYQVRNFFRDKMQVGDKAFFLPFELQGTRDCGNHGDCKQGLP